MLRALTLLFSPGKTWERMALKPPNALTVVIISLLPLMAVTLAAEGYGLWKFGEVLNGIGKPLPLPRERIIRYEAFYGVASFIVILAGTSLTKSVADSFGTIAPFAKTLVLMSCGFMPVFLMRVPDGIPQINTWICWAVGAALTARILYHGVALWLKPEQTKGFGLFLVSVVYTFVLSGLVHFAAIQVLHGKLLKNIYPDQPVSSAAQPR